MLAHAAVVAALTVKIHDIYEFNLEKSLKMALFHDYGETECSDVPHNVKEAWPVEVRREFERVELDVVEKNLGPEYRQLLQEFDECETPEALAVNYADILSVVMYCDREIYMGNKTYYETKVLPDAQRRVECIIKKLKPFKRDEEQQ